MHNQIREIHGYDQPIMFFREHPDIAYEIAMRTEERLTRAYTALRQRMHDMTRYTEGMTKKHRSAIEDKISLIEEKSTAIKRLESERDVLTANHNRLLQAKDQYMELFQEKHNAESRELKSALARANNEILKLAQSLSVRGMLERIECQLSNKRRSSRASRQEVWAEILDENEDIRRAVTCTGGRNSSSKIKMAIELILEIYKRASDKLHHAGHDEIPVRVGMYRAQELSVLRNLCTAAHYIMKEVQ